MGGRRSTGPERCIAKVRRDALIVGRKIASVCKAVVSSDKKYSLHGLRDSGKLGQNYPVD